MYIDERIVNENEMKAYGQALGQTLAPGAVIALIGDLGAGKTTLSKSIAEGLGVRERVTSPTFTIICEYGSGRLPLYHFDVYRLDDPEEMENLGYEEYFYGDGVTIVEWADKVEALLPKTAIRIRIDYNTDPETRTLSVKPNALEHTPQGQTADDRKADISNET
jgi:tRNA threonylcarbamoyladenosine biosynthesis protein TsaE